MAAWTSLLLLLLQAPQKHIGELFAEQVSTRTNKYGMKFSKCFVCIERELWHLGGYEKEKEQDLDLPGIQCWWTELFCRYTPVVLYRSDADSAEM